MFPQDFFLKMCTILVNMMYIFTFVVRKNLSEIKFWTFILVIFCLPSNSKKSIALENMMLTLLNLDMLLVLLQLSSIVRKLKNIIFENRLNKFMDFSGKLSQLEFHFPS